MKIRNWSKFQHFKDRRPPWIKLYREILDDPDWHELDAESSKILVMLWLIASEDENQEGELPEIKKLAFRLRIPENKLKQTLAKLSHWVYQDDISLISERCHVVIPETETETETKRETETKFDAIRHLVSLGVNQQVAQDYCKQRKKKPTLTAINGLEREVKKARISLQQALEICCARGWEGFKADWIKDKTQQLTGQQSAWLTITGQTLNNEDDYHGRTIEADTLPPALLGK